MLFLISLAAAVLFTALCGDILKKHPLPFYVGSAAAALFFALFPFKNAPRLVSEYLIALFSKGALAAAFFVLVMFAGAFKAGSKGAKKLMPIRAELAIVASLFTVTHLISYGLLYIKRLLSGAISPTQATVTYFAIPLVILLIPLAVTSFKRIRKKMEPKKWKKLQRFAYAFYFLLYVHILIAYMPSARHGEVKSIVNVIVYSAVFLTYAAMRISKALAKKHKSSEKKIGVSLSAAGAVAFAAVSLIAAMPAVEAKTAGDIPTSPRDESSALTSSAAASSKAQVSSSEASSKAETSQSRTESRQASESSSSGVSSKASSSSKSAASNSGKTASAQSSSAQSSAQPENTVTVTEQADDDRAEQQSEEAEAPREATAEQTANEPPAEPEESAPEVTPEEESRVFSDGEYTAKCFEEDDDVRVMITVKLTIENDRIVDIKVDSDETDTWYLDNVLEHVVPRITEREGSSLDDLDDIDAVSGATLSSNGVKRAVKDALDQARVS